MGDHGSSQMSYQQHSGESMLNCPSSGMNARPMTMHPGYGPGWDPVVSPGQSGSYGASSMVTRAKLTNSPSFPILHETHSGPSHLLNYPSDPNLAQLLPNFSMFGSENSHELANPYCLPPGSQNHNALFPRNYASTENGMDEKPSLHAPQAKRGCQVSEARTVGVSPNGKRKRDSEPNSPVNKTVGDVQKDHSCEPFRSKEPDDKRQKSEQNNAASSSDKQESKQVEDNSQGEEASKQNYIHVRARRGQATNSHSLAERVRREKISERMRLLQELVPGCNKITGKAVMLDEIINYVQSLQQQVEFLSMKLATVNPEVNFDIERLLTKDILHSRGSGQPILGFDQGMGSSHGFPLGVYQNMTTMPNASQYHHLSQAVWDGDLQSLLQMGFDPNTTNGGLGSNGASKTEL